MGRAASQRHRQQHIHMRTAFLLSRSCAGDDPHRCHGTLASRRGQRPRGARVLRRRRPLPAARDGRRQESPDGCAGTSTRPRVTTRPRARLREAPDPVSPHPRPRARRRRGSTPSPPNCFSPGPSWDGAGGGPSSPRPAPRMDHGLRPGQGRAAGDAPARLGADTRSALGW